LGEEQERGMFLGLSQLEYTLNVERMEEKALSDSEYNIVFFRPIFAENSDISLLSYIFDLCLFFMNIIFYLIGVNLAGSVDTVMQATQAEQKEEEGYNGKSTIIARLNEEEQLEMAMRESLRDLYQNGSMAAMKLAQQLGESIWGNHHVVVDDVGAKFHPHITWQPCAAHTIGFGGMIWNWLTFINIVLLSFVGAALDPQELYSCQLAMQPTFKIDCNQQDF
ncbi:hypothetical protein ACJX0J_035614, partial [Zea mays]